MGVVCFLIQYAVQSVLPFGRVCFAVCVIIAVPVGALIYFAAIIKIFTEEETFIRFQRKSDRQISKEIAICCMDRKGFPFIKKEEKSRSAMI